MIADHPVDAGSCADDADDFAGGSSALLRKGCFSADGIWWLRSF